MSGKQPWKKAMKLDSALHTPARIAILLFLMPRTMATFSSIQDALNLTAGNLSSHLKKLKEADYIIIEKKFVDSKPTTTAMITSKGHSSVVQYVEMLNSAIDLSNQ